MEVLEVVVDHLSVATFEFTNVRTFLEMNLAWAFDRHFLHVVKFP